MPAVCLGSLVQVPDRPALEEMLRSAEPGSRPEPEQMACASRTARVTGVRSDGNGRPRYALAGLPGEWLADWLRPL